MTSLALKLFWRDWRSGELTLLMTSLVLAVTIVTGISLFTDRLQLAVTAESSTFLAADRVLTSPRPVKSEWLTEAANRGIKQAKVLNFSSMVSSDSAMQFVSVKAVDKNYPLKGHLEISNDADSLQHPQHRHELSERVYHGPRAGAIWVDKRLLSLLDITLGTQLYVGAAQLTVTQFIVQEPDRGSTFFDFGPRVMMNTVDLEATGVVRPGSRIEYRYLFAAEQEELSHYLDWLRPQLEPSHKVIGLSEGQPNIASALSRSENFLLMASSLSVLLAGMAIALSSRRYSERHYDYVAVMKSLGASSNHIFIIYVLNLMVLTLAAIILGWFAGWGIQHGFFYFFRDLIAITVPNASLKPFVIGGVTAIVCLVTFALPPLWYLRTVSPLRVLRKDLPVMQVNALFPYSIGLIGIVGLLIWYSNNLLVALAMLIGCGLVFALVGVVAFLLLKMTSRIGMHAGSLWRLGFANLQRRLVANAVQVVIFSLSFMLVLMLILIRTSLIEEWRMQLPQGTPNHFFVNIAPAEVAEIRAFFNSHNISSAGLYPMVRGRLVEKNGESVAKLFAGKRIEGLNRELNLSWSTDLPEDNTIEQGQWWDDLATSKQGARQSSMAPVSVEQDFAESLGLKLGDTLTFTIAEHTLLAQVQNIRSLRWDGMRPNFYIIFPLYILDDLPTTYITSFYLAPHQKQLINEVAHQFPSVTVIELDRIIQRVEGIVDQVSLAVELVLALVIISGVLVLVASVQASMDVRYHENAVLRTMGASSRLILGSLLVEFAILGLLSGLLAALGAELVVYLVQTFVLLMEHQFHFSLWLAGPVLGTCVVALVGILFSYRVIRVSPLQVLRHI